MMGGSWAIVPIKDFASAKSRLAGILTGECRAAVARMMARDVLRALVRAPSIDRVIVMGQGVEQEQLAQEFGCDFAIDEHGAGLNGNLQRIATRLAARGVESLLMVPGDLPAIQAEDIERVLIDRATDVTICRARRDGGTNALLVSPPDCVEFQFGVDSASRHEEAASATGLAVRIVDDDAFSRDIDTPDDVQALLAQSPACETVDYLRRVGVGLTADDGLQRQSPGKDELTELGERSDLPDLMQSAAAIRDEGFDDVVTYSPKVFIPLTELCRDVCHYCTYAKTPRRVEQAYMTPAQVLDVARAGRDAGCREALFTLGDKPELRYRAAREALERLGYSSTLDYVAAMAELVRRETGLLPHINMGVLSPDDYDRLRPLAPSMGLMLESSSQRLCERGGAHYGSPDKDPDVRLQSICAAGEARVPLTSGILIGIGESREERVESLLQLRSLHERYGHIQEIIIQNFVAKPGTKMADAPAVTREELLWTIAIARHAFGARMSLQAPPNLNADDTHELIAAGINDWGGVSPVTPDYV
ncbi:MAG: 7,8-didemethyl-8-hydroxy-5-deazariboflavin synthase CofG, partial [Gammaproteobacteria bacterium]|nr:7,8-didemethyl-8-hydroxy-5-deazariboflavin synthase CofG [Gammaproteobacteria bacterium]